MNRIMPFLSKSFVIFGLSTLLVSGCVGSSTDSGGPSNIFLGKQKVYFAASRLSNYVGEEEFRLVRDGTQITITDQNFTISAELPGSEFKVTSPDIPILNRAAGRPDCTNDSFNVTYEGTVTDSLVSGRLYGTYNCHLFTHFTGNFTASNEARTSSSKLPSIALLVDR